MKVLCRDDITRVAFRTVGLGSVVGAGWVVGHEFSDFVNVVLIYTMAVTRADVSLLPGPRLCGSAKGGFAVKGIGLSAPILESR